MPLIDLDGNAVDDDELLITKYYAVLVVALLTGMSDFEKEKLLEKAFLTTDLIIQAKSLYVDIVFFH